MPLIVGTIEKIIPDPQAAADAKLKAMELAQRGEFAQLDADTRVALAQLEVNKVEAASPDLFRGGWRPSVGWVCVAGLGYDFLARPLLPWLATLCGFTVPALPPIDIESLLVLLTGMLGIGGLRTVEKVKGRA
ncbi:MAG: holin family protein [Rhodocyclaceae bacterium]|nr:holin family protein [Rhodocyclaceae bacterium]